MQQPKANLLRHAADTVGQCYHQKPFLAIISGITTFQRWLLRRSRYSPSDLVLSQHAMASAVADTSPDSPGALNDRASLPTMMPSTVVNSHGVLSVLTRRGSPGECCNGLSSGAQSVLMTLNICPKDPDYSHVCRHRPCLDTPERLLKSCLLMSPFCVRSGASSVSGWSMTCCSSGSWT